MLIIILRGRSNYCFKKFAMNGCDAFLVPLQRRNASWLSLSITELLPSISLCMDGVSDSSIEFGHSVRYDTLSHGLLLCQLTWKSIRSRGLASSYPLVICWLHQSLVLKLPFHKAICRAAKILPTLRKTLSKSEVRFLLERTTEDFYKRIIIGYY